MATNNYSFFANILDLPSLMVTVDGNTKRRNNQK